jgi:hypothetical protein
MNQLHAPKPRWRNAQGGRRVTDLHSGQRTCTDTREEVGRLKTAIQTLIEAVQALTAGRPRT